MFNGIKTFFKEFCNAASKFWQQHTLLAIALIASFLLLTSLLLIQVFCSDVLALETRWLIVAGMPVLLALLVGGYIKSFKGFGLEIEASIKQSITSIDLVATEAMSELYGDEKKSLSYLFEMTEEQRKHISRLVFVQGRPNYYKSYAVTEYIRMLANLEYFEIQDQNGRFIALIPAKHFSPSRIDNNYAVDDFLNALDSSIVVDEYRSILIKNSVGTDSDLITCLKSMRKHRLDKIVVLDENLSFVGLLLEKSIERKIVDVVISAADKANTASA